MNMYINIEYRHLYPQIKSQIIHSVNKHIARASHASSHTYTHARTHAPTHTYITVYDSHPTEDYLHTLCTLEIKSS